MPNQPRVHIPDAWHLDLKMSLPAGPLGSWGFSVIKGAGTFDHGTCQDIADMIANAVSSNNVNDAWGTDVRFSGVTFTSYDQPTRAQIFIPEAVDGVETGDLLPSNVAAITSFRTDLTGPAHRGRSYIPGYTEASADGNEFNSTSAGNLETFWEDVVTGLGVSGVSGLGVMSKVHTSVTPVTSVIVERMFATQRRRLSRARR
jgi:hypothetical protein